MALIARFVDSIAATATVRLDVNDGDLWRLQATSRFDPPRAKRARVSTLLTDGAQYPATAYDDRVLELRWLLEAETTDIVAGEVQKLARELDRPQNFFEYRPDGASQSVFFRTHRLGLDAVDMPTDGTRLWLEVNVPAEPFAYGLKESLGPFTVNNNPVAGSNPQQFDIAAGVVKGDVDTPCIVRLPGATINAGNTMVAVRHRDLSGLHYALQAEAATTLGADTTLQANDPAFSGAGSNYARTTFATQANALRLLLPTWPPNPSHPRYRGKYRILLRYRKNGAGDTDQIRVRLLWGGQSINSAILGDFVMLSTQVFGNGSFHWADLGVFQLPPSPDPGFDGYSGTAVPVKGVLSALQVERLTGTSTLDMDVLVPVPCDEDFAYVHFQPGFDGLSFPALGVLDGVWRMAYGQETDLTMPNHPACAVVGVFPTLRPAVANRVYVIPNVATFNPSDSITTTMAVTVDYWPRYLSVRPVST